MRLDPSGCRAKLDHAESHIDLLRSEIAKACPEDGEAIALRRQYEPAEGAVVYRIDRVIQIGDQWPLVVGDAVHNLRGALDHLMWQLARKHLGRTPTKREAKDIQFPEVRRAQDVSGNRFLKYVDAADVATLKRFQPFKRLKRGQLHPLPKLIRLSNIDKHRKLHLLAAAPHKGSFTNLADAYRDCVPAPRPMPGGGQVHAHHTVPRRNPRPGDPILHIFVAPTGPNPDVDFNAKITGFVALGRLGPIVPALDAMRMYVGNVLDAFC